ncbi:gastrula zinc finger protein XlCGF8.2DB-like isoform X2 [Wyeomyia smithii]|nr:gastrula zinc finger protein XlCGF8.2DB-like isoform X2 [Wyeomyia smithii]
MDVCSKCERSILDFYLFKERSRQILRHSTKFTNKVQFRNEQHSTIQENSQQESVIKSLVDNYKETVDALEKLDPSVDPIVEVSNSKKKQTTNLENKNQSKSKRGQYRRIPPEVRLAEKLRPKRKIQRKTEEEKAMSPTEYKRYYYSTHIAGKYNGTCELCGKRIATDRMEGHMNGHKGLKPYVCDICGLRSNCKLNMRAHMARNHGEDQRIPCTMCDKVFRCQQILKAHMRGTHDEKKETCPLCGLKSANKHALARHLRIHTQTRDYVCPQCGKAFYCQSVLNIHLRTHTGETPYICSICTKGFVHRRMYVIHMKALHPGEPLMTLNKHAGITS